MMRYFAEFNRVLGDNIRTTARRLTRMGLPAYVLPHMTALIIERPAGVTWKQFTNSIRSVLQPKRGSILIASETTGRAFICSNKGNRPGHFERV